jgi:glucose-1-phosphate adenylyltransferase
MHHLANHEHNYVLILSGDQLYQMDLEEIANFHVEQGADVTIATTPVVAKDAPGFGIMKVNEGSWIETFIEKPPLDKLEGWESVVPEKFAAQGKHYLASMGIYMFNREFLKKLFDDYPGYTDFGKEIIPKAITGGYKVASYPYGGYWEDIGTIRSFFEANIALAKPIPEFNLFDAEYPIYTRPRILAPSKIFGTTLLESVMAEGCISHANKIEHSIIGIRSRIGSGTTIKRSIVMGADYYETLKTIQERQEAPNDAPIGIGENCHIENAIVDKDVRIGNNVTIRGSLHPNELEDVETDTYSICDGIVVLQKKAYIPEGTEIGLTKVESG